MRLTTTLLMTLMVCACGQKGPLFMPDKSGEASEASSTVSAPDNPQLSHLQISHTQTSASQKSNAPSKAQFEAQFNLQTSSSNP